MKVTLAQQIVTRDLDANLAKILDVVKSASLNEWVVFPEGIVSGYAPEDPAFTLDLNSDVIDHAIEEVVSAGRDRGCHCIFGAVTRTDGLWHNSVVIASAGKSERYDKVELSARDRNHFTPGTGRFVSTLDGVRFGVVACRELLLPDIWRGLEGAGAEIIFHVNNAIQTKDAIWEHVLISRAVENASFVCSVNNAASPQALASYLIAPWGTVLLKADLQRELRLTNEVDPSDAIRDLANRTDF